MTSQSKYNLSDLGKAALMLQWLTYRHKPIYREINHYPMYFFYDYGIDNPQRDFYELYEHGYLEKLSLFTSLSYYTMSELLDICLSLGVLIKGKKGAVIAHLLSLNRDDEIDILLPHGPCFGLTSKGSATVTRGRKHVLEKHQHLFEINNDMSKSTIEMR